MADPYLSSVVLLLSGSGTDGSTTFTDTSPSAHTLTATGGAALSNAVGTPFGAGTAMHFNGSGAKVSEAAHSTDFDFGGDFTVEFWAYKTSDGGDTYDVAVSSEVAASPSGGWQVTANSNDISFNHSNGNYVTGSAFPNGTTWHFIAVSRVGSAIRVYCDGTSIASFTSSAAYPSSSVLVIGAGTTSGVQSFNGYLYDLRITNGVGRYSGPTMTVPTASFSSTSGGSGGSTDPYSSDVLLLLHGDGTSGSTTLTDSSSFAHNAIAHNGAALSAVQSKFGGSSILLDGTDDYISVTPTSDWTFGTADFTIEFEFYPVNMSVSPFAFYMGGVGGSDVSTLVIVVSPDGYLEADIDDLALGNGSSTPVALTGQWSHIAIVRQGTTFRLFCNGTEVCTFTSSFSFDAPTSIYFGRYSDASPIYCGAYYDEIRVTKGVARYTASFTAPTAAFPDPPAYTPTIDIADALDTGTLTSTLYGGQLLVTDALTSGTLESFVVGGRVVPDDILESGTLDSFVSGVFRKVNDIQDNLVGTGGTVLDPVVAGTNDWQDTLLTGSAAYPDNTSTADLESTGTLTDAALPVTAFKADITESGTLTDLFGPGRTTDTQELGLVVSDISSGHTGQETAANLGLLRSFTYGFTSGDLIDTATVASEATDALLTVTDTTSEGVLADEYTEARLTISDIQDQVNSVTQALNQIVTSALAADLLLWQDQLSDTAKMHAWVLNTETTSLSRYTQLPVRTMAVINGKLLGLGPDGFYVLDDVTDDGVPIPAAVVSGNLSFGSEYLKRLDSIRFGYSATGPLAVTVQGYAGGDNNPYTYALPARTAESSRGNKITPGKGLRSRYFRFSITNPTGAAFDIDTAVVDVAESTTRRI